MCPPIESYRNGLTSLSGALEYFKHKAVEFLITDIHLTRTIDQSSFEGLDLIQQVADNYPETRIIAMSSDPKLETYQRSFTLGALAFLKKPIISSDEIAVAMDAARKQWALKNAAYVHCNDLKVAD